MIKINLRLIISRDKIITIRTVVLMRTIFNTVRKQENTKDVIKNKVIKKMCKMLWEETVCS